jgi:tetratricopeptide (TPR) repeat protein
MKQNVSQIIERADALYGGREQIGRVRESLRQLESVAAGGDDFEIMWRTGRALFFLGQEEERKDKAAALHARGAEPCVRAARLEPRRVEGHFWLGVNLALQAQAARSLAALPLAWRARRELERAAQINPAYHAAGPLRVLARLAHKLPRLVGGGYARASAEFARAIEIAPANTVTRIYFAEMLLDAGEAPRARRELEALLQAPLDVDWEFETKRDRLRARELLEKIRSST